MTISLVIANDPDAKKWDDAVLASPHGTIFHTYSWLKIVEKNTGTTLYPILAYKGTELVALYPIYVRKLAFFNIALSPPSGVYLLYLGPAFLGYEQLKQDKKETLYHTLQAAIDKFIFNDLHCIYSRIRTSPGLLDSRPLVWQKYQVEPYFTYRIDLSKGVDHVWEQFDRKLRGDIKKAIREGVTIKTGSREDLDFIQKSLSRRFAEQGYTPLNHEKYLLDLYSAFAPDNLKIFLAEFRNQVVGGMVALRFKDVAYLWIGVPKGNLPGISANDLVQWEGIQWACNNGCTYYEEMDSGEDPRLTSYKSKYNPDICIWYSAVRHSSRIIKTLEYLKNTFR